MNYPAPYHWRHRDLDLAPRSDEDETLCGTRPPSNTNVDIVGVVRTEFCEHSWIVVGNDCPPT